MLLHYIDNEVPDFAEWTSILQSADATIIQTPEASFPDRGHVGIRCSFGSQQGQAAVHRALSNIGPELYLGVWARFSEEARFAGSLIMLLSGQGLLSVNTPGADSLSVYQQNVGLLQADLPCSLNDGRWHYLVLHLRTGNGNGSIRLWLDAELILDEGDLTVLPGDDLTGLAIGVVSQQPLPGGANGWLDLDEIRIATEYPAPFAPEASSLHVEPFRTLVLFASRSSDSRGFAETARIHLGIPLANLVSLPNATSAETLGDYASWQNEVETDLLDWLTRHPGVAGQACCLLIAPGVPGFFQDGDKRISATSRLMNVHALYTGPVTNPFLGHSVRPTADEILAEGMYLVSRIDAPTLAAAEAALRVDSRPAGDHEYLLAEDGNLRESVAAQQTRLRRGAIYDGSQDVTLLVGDVATILDGRDLPGTGSRNGCIDRADICTTLRNSTNTLTSALMGGWASGAAWTGAETEEFDVSAYLKSLTHGWTVSEAMLAGLAIVDGHSVVAGNPLLVCSFPRAGFNIYSGPGGVEGVDFSRPVACLRSDEEHAQILSHLRPDQWQCFVARAVSSDGIEEHGLQVLLTLSIDNAGAIRLGPILPVRDLIVTYTTDGKATVAFTNTDPTVTGFEILGGCDANWYHEPLASAAAVSTISEYRLTFEPPTLPLHVAVRPCRDSETGPLSEIKLLGQPSIPFLPATLE
jgi:hypothetical protein